MVEAGETVKVKETAYTTVGETAIAAAEVMVMALAVAEVTALGVAAAEETEMVSSGNGNGL